MTAGGPKKRSVEYVRYSQTVFTHHWERSGKLCDGHHKQCNCLRKLSVTMKYLLWSSSHSLVGRLNTSKSANDGPAQKLHTWCLFTDTNRIKRVSLVTHVSGTYTWQKKKKMNHHKYACKQLHATTIIQRHGGRSQQENMTQRPTNKKRSSSQNKHQTKAKGCSKPFWSLERKKHFNQRR